MSVPAGSGVSWMPRVTLSIASHKQNHLVNRLLEDIGRYCPTRLQVVVTEEKTDPEPLDTQALSYPVSVAVTSARETAAEIHNAVLERCVTPYFCSASPDIRLSADPFPPLLQLFSERRV